MNKKYKAVIFDFDGVLMNTHLLCYEIHLELNPDLQYDSFQDMSNGNFIHTVKADHEKGVFKRNPDFYSKYKNQVCNYEVPAELKNIISESKSLFFIVSSGNEEILKGEIEKAGLSSKFLEILGEDTHADKDHKILSILDKYSLNNKDVVFVTDTLGDVLEGKKAGVNVVGVTWGLHGKDKLQEGYPDYIIDSIEELKNFF